MNLSDVEVIQSAGQVTLIQLRNWTYPKWKQSKVPDKYPYSTNSSTEFNLSEER